MEKGHALEGQDGQGAAPEDAGSSHHQEAAQAAALPPRPRQAGQEEVMGRQGNFSQEKQNRTQMYYIIE